MGQDRVRPLALALQGLDYTVGGQTEGGGRVCSSGGGKEDGEGAGGCTVDVVEKGEREEGQGSVA